MHTLIYVFGKTVTNTFYLGNYKLEIETWCALKGDSGPTIVCGVCMSVIILVPPDKHRHKFLQGPQFLLQCSGKKQLSNTGDSCSLGRLPHSLDSPPPKTELKAGIPLKLSINVIPALSSYDGQLFMGQPFIHL